MTPDKFLQDILDPGLLYLGRTAGTLRTDASRTFLLAVAGQQGGPARSFWQFEEGGGVAGVLGSHAASPAIQAVCRALEIAPVIGDIYEAMAWNDHLQVAMARMLLLTDPYKVPTTSDGAWSCYLRLWRPGRPRPETWGARWTAAVSAVAGQTHVTTS